MGMHIQPPGNHCLEYQDSVIIGKCNIRVTATSVRISNDGPDWAEFMVLATDMVSGTIKTLIPK